MALVSGSTKGIEIMMKRVNKFMEYNNVIINETKSQYHWNNSKKGPADLRTVEFHVCGPSQISEIASFNLCPLKMLNKRLNSSKDTRGLLDQI
jgi:hypothetical protein